MVIILSHAITPEDKARLRQFLESKNYQVREIVGKTETIFGAVGLPTVDPREVEILPGVDKVIPISKPYKLASREMRKDDTVVSIGPVKIGGGRIAVIAGPCAVEGRDQIFEAARVIRASGAVMLRGGAYKPRTSPYAFQGLGEQGLRLLKEAGDAYGMPVASEVVSIEHIPAMREYVDLFQIGARNMQNYELLKAVGKTGKPVILKRGLSALIEEWLMAAEYLLSSGTDDVILCERGIRTFETYTRNTLDISAIPVVSKLSHLPVIVDPSHATGIREKVPPVALAAVAAGAHGLIVEVHPDPPNAFSDGPQSLFPEQFEKLMRDIEALSPVLGKELGKLPTLRVPGASVGLPATDAPRADGRGVVAFQGEHGAYSEIALNGYFAFPVESRACASFEDVFRSVLEARVDYGIVPVENSLAGSVHENYDLLLQYADLKIVGETKLRIVHSLIGLPGSRIEDIKRVYSHPQGLAQCRRFIKEVLAAEPVPYYDTAGAVAFIAREGRMDCAAIANAEAAALHGLAVLKTGIESNPRNYTRFVVLSRLDAPIDAVPNKASIVFSTPDTPGSLFACLQVLADRGLNMKKLESRPILGKPWQYMFYADLDVGPDQEAFLAAMDVFRSKAGDFRILGMYRV